MLQKIKLILVINIAFLYIFIAQNAFASTATMALSPASGAFDKPFTVSLVIDGHGDKFNAAQSTISLSHGLAIKDLALGNCNFSYLKTPSTQDPSFAGIILSTYSTRCTVYTLTLIPTAKTNANITLTKAQIRRYGDAANILSTSTGGSYSLTAAYKAPEIVASQSPGSSQTEAYAVNVYIISADNAPVRDTTVILSNVSNKKQKQRISDQNGLARFSDLQSGIYDTVVMRNNAKMAETIINVSGQNHTLTFSINLKEQQNNPLIRNTSSVLGAATSSPYLFAGMLAAGIAVGVVLAFLIFKWKQRKTVQT